MTIRIQYFGLFEDRKTSSNNQGVSKYMCWRPVDRLVLIIYDKRMHSLVGVDDDDDDDDDCMEAPCV